MQNQQEGNNKSILYAIIIILLLFNLGLFYLWQKGNSTRDALTSENSSLAGTVKQKENLLAAADAMIAQYKSDSLAMSSANKKISTELAEKGNEIARLAFQLRQANSSSNKNQQLINELTKKLAVMGDRLAQLEKENVELKEKNATLATANDQLTNENTVLSKEGRRLKNLAARIQSSEIRIETLKKQWITRKETNTNRAKDVEALRISFNLAENKVAEAGERNIFIKITGPEGVTLSRDGEGGIAELLDGKSTKYSYKTNVVFEKDSKQVPATVWKPSNKLTKGKYSIELFTEGYLMGSSVIDLK
jgi:hypothetical protein